jgi:hypothetical protein
VPPFRQLYQVRFLVTSAVGSLLTYLFHLPSLLLQHAVLGLINERLVAIYGSALVMPLDFVWSWVIPALFAAVAMWFVVVFIAARATREQIQQVLAVGGRNAIFDIEAVSRHMCDRLRSSGGLHQVAGRLMEYPTREMLMALSRVEDDNKRLLTKSCTAQVSFGNLCRTYQELVTLVRDIAMGASLSLAGDGNFVRWSAEDQAFGNAIWHLRSEPQISMLDIEIKDMISVEGFIASRSLKELLG